MDAVYSAARKQRRKPERTPMNTIKGKAAKLIAVALTIAVSQVCAQVGLAAGDIVQGPQGRLTTGGNNPVTVNGNSARSGETIFSGQRIQTPAGTGATVQLGQLGRLDIAPSTDVTLTFEAERIDVSVASGCVILTANRGVAGSVEAGGSTERTNQAEGGTIDICTGRPAGAPPIVGQGAASAAGAGAGSVTVAVPTVAAAGGGLSSATAIALTAASVTTFALLANQVISDSEPCPSTPADPSNLLPDICN